MGRLNQRPGLRAAEPLVVLSLLLIILAVRIYRLDADPPIGLSTSTGIYTDPPQYTLFAKTYAQSGDFNPYDDHRFVFFIKSAVTVLASAVFKLIGVGMRTSNFVGLLYSFGALVLFFFFVRKTSGLLAGVLFLVLIGLNYNLIFYGRLPFLEHAMMFFVFASLVLLSYFPTRIVHLSAGVLLAVGVFFGKVIGLVFLFPFACCFLYRLRYEERGVRWPLPVLFAAGFAAVTVFWVSFSYLPMREQITGYLGEQAVTLYGAPEGLQSFDNFVWKMVTFGDVSKLFQRMKPAALIGAFFVGMILYHAARKKSWKSGFGKFNSGHIFMAAMLVSFYGALMIWNYRPLRYQLALIFPFYGAAATVLSMLWQRWKERDPEKAPYPFLLLILPLVMVPVYQFYCFWVEGGGQEFYYDDYKYVVAAWSLVIAAAVFVIVTLFKQGKIPKRPVLGKIMVVVVCVITLYKGALDYRYWAERPSFSARDNSRDLGMLLSPEAVLSGPFAGQLTLENDLGTVIHMFGVSEADPDLFTRFPITHLLLDKANESRAREDFPDVMDSAFHLRTYHVGLKKARLFRIAGHTGNAIADSYRPSTFERLTLQLSDSLASHDNKLALEFVQRHPHNMSCYLLLAEVAEKDRLFDIAETLYKKSVEFSPTNFDLNARLAKFYHDRFDESGDNRRREQGLLCYERALRYAPTVSRIKESYHQLKGD